MAEEVAQTAELKLLVVEEPGVDLAGTERRAVGIRDGRTPRNPPLGNRARDIGREVGLALEETAVGGGSDGNLPGPPTPPLNGLGPVGDGAHARHEHVIISKMIERSALLAALLMTA